jgi:hypothetical protein
MSAHRGGTNPGKPSEERTMSEVPTSQSPGSGRYEIRLEGHLDDRWAAWFDGLSLTQESDGSTVIHGSVVDQAALHGLLQKVRDLGLPLVSVRHADSDPPDQTDQSGQRDQSDQPTSPRR